MNQREIKFRGICNLNAQWVYGSLVQGIDQKGNPFTQIEVANANEHRVYYVQPDTVGQYTGLNDKNGEEAFEGDIVPLERMETATKRVRENCVIVWNAKKGMWSYKWPDGYVNPGPIDGIENKTVIGNIYENPERLK